MLFTPYIVIRSTMKNYVLCMSLYMCAHTGQGPRSCVLLNGYAPNLSKINFNVLLHLFIYLFIHSFGVWEACHGVWVEVRAQFAGVSSLIPLCGY